jgi:hypothetical protein
MHSCFCEVKLPSLKLKTWAEPVLGHGVGICDIDFFNFRHSQVRTFKILNHFKRDGNFVVNFQKVQKQNQKLMQYSKYELNLNNMTYYTVKNQEILGNFAKFCKLL